MNPRELALRSLLDAHPRVALLGGPDSGSKELAHTICEGRPIFYASDYDRGDWKGIPGAIRDALTSIDSFLLVGGVHVARALRKGLEVDGILYLDHRDRLSSQTNTIFMEWRRTHLLVPVISPDRYYAL